MKNTLNLILFLIISSITVSSQTQCPVESLCETCIEEGGFYCGDNPENWTSYSPDGCVPHYYLNDGWHDCQDGSDEDGAVPTSACLNPECSLDFIFEIIDDVVNIQAIEFPNDAELIFTVNGNEIEAIDDAIEVAFLALLNPVSICVFYTSDDCPDGIEFCETIDLSDILTEDLGCYDDSGNFYDVGSEWFFTDCEFIYCESPGNWSAINVLEDCLGCFDEEGTFYDLGDELFIDDTGCAFIFCETPNTWSDIIVIPDCEGAGCYLENGDSYAVGAEVFYNDCEYIYCESPGNWSDIQVIPGCGIDCDFTIEASIQDDVPCDLNWLFQLNGIEEDTDNIFWDFGDGTSGESNWLTEHVYSEDGVYIVTAYVFTPLCELVTVVTEVVIEGCNEGEDLGCYDDSGNFYDVGSEWFFTDCEFIYCESPGNWSAINVLEDCLGCFDEEGTFYDLGDELFIDDTGCAFIFCETPNTWSDIIVIPDCEGAGCYLENGDSYAVGAEVFYNDCEYIYCESPGNWSDIQVIPGCGIDCDFTIEASIQDDVPCDLNWLFQLNGIEEDTDNIFWDFGDGTSGESNWLTEHVYSEDGVYIVTAYVFTPLCELVTVVTEVVIEGCNEGEDLGCYDEENQFYLAGEIMVVSDDFCENYTCSQLDLNGGEYGFIPNWEIYPDCYQDDCVNEDQINENLPCPDVYAPVCGCNGVTYGNECEAFFYGGVTDWTDGECEQDSTGCNIFFEWYINPNGVFIAEAFVEPEGTEISWWVNGDEYGDGNTIEYNMSNLLDPIDVCVGAETADCGVFEECQTIFPIIEEFGCYDGDQFYPVGFTLYLDECEYIICEGLENWSEVIEIEDCDDEGCFDQSVIDNQMACNDLWAPVCGCDGVTYSNECYAYYYHGITEWTDGECGGPEFDCEIDIEGWHQGSYAVYEALNYPEGVILQWLVDGEFYSEGSSYLELDNLDYYASYQDGLDICVGYSTENCGEVYTCETITFDGNPNNPCSLELWAGVEDGIAMFEAYDFPEGVNLIWYINEEVYMNGISAIEIIEIPSGEFTVCVGYETEECGWVEVCEEFNNAGEDCNGSIVAIPPKLSFCEWAFELNDVDPNCTVYWDFGDGTEGYGSALEGHTYEEDGTYVVTATYFTDACPDGVALVITIEIWDCENDTSVDELATDVWTVHPIPTTENLTVIGLPDGSWSAKLYDATGREVYNSTVKNGSKLFINELGSGMYTMQIVGLTSSAKRVIVQR